MPTRTIQKAMARVVGVMGDVRSGLFGQVEATWRRARANCVEQHVFETQDAVLERQNSYADTDATAVPDATCSSVRKLLRVIRRESTLGFPTSPIHQGADRLRPLLARANAHASEPCRSTAS
jgi:hypothetical protein